MSMLLTAKALQIKVGNPLRKLVLVKLADNANDQGMCFPSYQYIADVCEISRRSVINHIDALIEMGLVSKKERKNKDGSSSNVYFLHLNMGSKIPAPPSAGDSLGSAGDSLGSAGDALPPSAGDAPITNHSINQSINQNNILTDIVNAPAKKSNRSEKSNSSKSALEILAEYGITDQLAKDFITHRKQHRAAITQTAMRRLQAEADKAGLPIAEVLEIIIERGWRGFKANWDWGGSPKTPKRGDNMSAAWNTAEEWENVF